MSKSVLSAKHFHDEEAAYAWVEARLWPNGPICPHCGGVERISKMKGKSTRLGLYKCYQCRKPFRVTVGTIFEASHIPLHLWLQAIALMSASKKGISSNQLHRILGIGLKAAWFLSHRIREMTIGTIVAENLSREAVVHTDESRIYGDVIGMVAGHETVKHSAGEYVRYTDTGVIHTNSAEGYFGIFKRGMNGVYHYCAEKHLHRYLAEFDFRYNHRIALGINDADRADQVLRGVVGKRLTYRTIN